jgi:hypothetical protein
MRRRRRRVDLLDTLPPLSDEAVVMVADFLAELLCRFEGRYYAQIHRYYEKRRAHRQPGIQPPPADTDPPF